MANPTPASTAADVLLAGIVLALALLALLASTARAGELPTPALSVPPLDAAHAEWGSVLATVVRTTGIDYARLRADHAALDRYRAQLAVAPLPAARPARLAHLINAYNALTMALVVELLPVDPAAWPRFSVKDQPGFWTAWRFQIAGDWRTLDDIEHRELRPLGDPRIHVAINCGARSCPALPPVPVTAATIEAQLEAATRAFVRDPSQVRFDPATGRLTANPILDWYGQDFAAGGGVGALLRARLDDSPARRHLEGGGPVGFWDYDWALNLAPPAPAATPVAPVVPQP